VTSIGSCRGTCCVFLAPAHCTALQHIYIPIPYVRYDVTILNACRRDILPVYNIDIFGGILSWFLYIYPYVCITCMLIYVTSPVMPQSQTLAIDTFCRNTLQYTEKHSNTQQSTATYPYSYLTSPWRHSRKRLPQTHFAGFMLDGFATKRQADLPASYAVWPVYTCRYTCYLYIMCTCISYMHVCMCGYMHVCMCGRSSRCLLDMTCMHIQVYTFMLNMYTCVLVLTMCKCVYHIYVYIMHACMHACMRGRSARFRCNLTCNAEGGDVDQDNCDSRNFWRSLFPIHHLLSWVGPPKSGLL